jgi:hypothetical protein
MDTLRIAELNEERDRHQVEVARKTAIEVAADAALQRRGRALTAAQLNAFEEASPYARMSSRQLDWATLGNGNCDEQDPEQWYPTCVEDPARTERLEEEQALAERLCGGCPVRAQCLARDYAHADGHVQQLWGITGGLGARDRRTLLPLWVELANRLDNSPADLTTKSAEITLHEGKAVEVQRTAVA